MVVYIIITTTIIIKTKILFCSLIYYNSNVPINKWELRDLFLSASQTWNEVACEINTQLLQQMNFSRTFCCLFHFVFSFHLRNPIQFSQNPKGVNKVSSVHVLPVLSIRTAQKRKIHPSLVSCISAQYCMDSTVNHQASCSLFTQCNLMILPFINKPSWMETNIFSRHCFLFNFSQTVFNLLRPVRGDRFTILHRAK